MIAEPWKLYNDRQRYLYLAVLFLVSTSNVVDRQIISVVVEPIKTEFAVSDTMIGLLSGLSFALVYATLGVPIARYADRGDRRLVLTISLSVWSVMTLVCGLAQSFWQLLAARAGVGAGEAGAIPPSQSLIADYFKPENRSTALAIFFLSAAAGNVIGLVVGGMIAESYGWRTVFVVFGLLGLPLAIATRLFLSEPRNEALKPIAAQPSENFAEALSILRKKKSFVFTVCGLVSYYMMIYGAQAFAISFVIRSHSLELSEATRYVGAVSVIAALLGTISGGFLADWLSSIKVAWLARIPAVGFMIAMPLLLCAYTATTLFGLLILFGLGLFVVMIAAPPIFSCLHAVCGSRRRATAISVAYFFANLLGLGLGPLLTGALSDGFASMVGEAEGLRYSLMATTLLFVPASIALALAGGNIEQDMET